MQWRHIVGLNFWTVNISWLNVSACWTIEHVVNYNFSWRLFKNNNSEETFFFHWLSSYYSLFKLQLNVLPNLLNSALKCRLSTKFCSIDLNCLFLCFRFVPSQADVAAFDALKGACPDKAAYPHAARWYRHIESFEAAGKRAFINDIM